MYDRGEHLKDYECGSNEIWVSRSLWALSSETHSVSDYTGSASTEHAL